jgi:two-component system, cell cycle sensor histidine kinase and response regulator CckA
MAGSRGRPSLASVVAPRHFVRTGLGAVLLAVSYYLCALLGLSLRLPHGRVAVFWPPNAIILLALLLSPARAWAIYLLALVGGFVAAAAQDQSWTRVFTFTVANTVEVLVAAAFVRGVLRGPPRFVGLREAIVFLLGAVLLATSASATIAALVFIWEPGVSYGLIWRIWFLGDLLGQLIVAPLLLVWARGGWTWLRTLSLPQRIEGSLLVLGLAATAIVALGGDMRAPGVIPALVYTPLPFLLWAAVRFGTRGLFSSLLLVTLLAIWQASTARGPFAASGGPDENVLSLQLFLTIVAISLMLLVSLVEERRQAMTEMRLLREIVEETPDCVAVIGLGGEVRYLNGAGHRLLGISDQQEMTTLSVFDLHPDTDGQRVVQEGLPTARSFGMWRGETHLRARDGQEILTSQVIMRHLDARGKLAFFSTVVRDLSERQRAEQERLRWQAQLQGMQKIESLGVLAGGIAHDFNNLLTGILGSAELARAALAPKSAVAPLLDDVARCALQAATLTKQMLDFAGKGRIAVRPLRLGDLVRELTPLLEAALPKGVVLHYALSASDDAVEADSAQLQQVIVNLIMNAGEAMADGDGTITLATGTLSHGGDDDLAPGQYAWLEVSDTGAGMDKTTCARLFEPFFTTKPKRRGMGLATALGIIGSHRGSIRVRSTPGRGTTFTVLLPSSRKPVAADGPAHPRHRADHLRADGVPPLLLVVDDEEIVREFISKALVRAGYRVQIARDGRQAIEQFQAHAHEIALVLMDVTMPNLDGVEASAAIQRLQPDARIVLMSGYSNQTRSQTMDRGLAGFLPKPFRLARLLEVIDAALATDVGASNPHPQH